MDNGHIFDDSFFTYEEWQEHGYHVVKGEKSHKRNESGKCVFSRDQVEENYDPGEDQLALEFVDQSDLY